MIDLALDILGDARFLSVVAIVLSLVTLVRGRRLQSMQTRLTALELAAKERVEAVRQKGDIRARIVPSGRQQWKVLIENHGAAATNVDIEFLAGPPRDPMLSGERQKKLPIPVLESKQYVPLHLTLAMGVWPPFDIALTWTDPDGSAQRKTTILYEPS